MNKILLVCLIIFTCAFPAEPKNTSTLQVSEQNIGAERLGRVGNYGYPNNPKYDRAKGYLLRGKVKNAVSNHGNFVTWDYHPSGFWNKYGYVPFSLLS